MPPEEPTIQLSTRVPADSAGTPLIEFLCARFRYLRRPAWEVRIADGRVTVDGAVVTPGHPLRRGVVVGYARSAEEPDAPTDVRVVFDRDGIVVVDKPAGLPFHADGAFLTRTVVGVLARQLGVKPRPVHRLDRETSGLCVLARDRATARALNEELARRGFEKVYDALVRGRVAADRFIIDAPIGRHPSSCVSIRRAVAAGDAADAEPAVTEVEVVARGATATWVRCVPRTGRTHQIRVHLESRGHALVGDKLYGRSDDEFVAWVAHVKAGGAAGWDGRLGAPHQMLHARRLGFTSPRTGERLEFEVEPPHDFVAVACEMGIARP